MHRRQFLTAIPPFVSVGIAGCIDLGGNPNTPDSMDVNVYYTRNPFEEGVEGKLEADDQPTSYQTVFTDRTEAEARLILSAVSRSRLSYPRSAENLHTVTTDSIKRDDDLEEFVQETDFEASYLLTIVAGFWSSSYELELVEIDRTSFGLSVSLRTEQTEEEVTMDSDPLSAVLRVTDEETDIPDEVLVTVNGDDADQMAVS